MMESAEKNWMTIVVPVYNRPNLIIRCLESLKAQTYRPLHIIIVDNASTDNTKAKVEAWKDDNASKEFTLAIYSDSRKGAAYARETGLEHVKTDRVMFFDSDDTLRPRCVETVMNTWRQESEIDVIAWPVAIHDGEEVRITHSIKGNLLERHLVHAIFRTHGYAVKTEFLRKVGGWKGAFPNWNDLETGARLLLLDPKVKALSEPFVDVYHQKESITGNNFSEKAGKWEMSLDGIDDSIDESGRSDKARLHNIISYRRAILAAHYAKEGHPELSIPLYEETLQGIPDKKRPLIRFAYHWTKSGLRGAFSIVGKFL